MPRLPMSLPVAIAVIGTLAGCNTGSDVASNAKVQSGEQLLRWSMDQQKALKSFSAKSDWMLVADGGAHKFQSQRDIVITAPNQYRVVTRTTNGSMTVISDGQQQVEYGSRGKQDAFATTAPPSIAYATGVIISEPTLAGSLLYNFFGGSNDFDHVVDKTRGAVVLGQEETAPTGEKAKNVSFYALDPYGHVEALIGEQTGMVYRIQADLAPISEMAEKRAKASGAGEATVPKNVLVTETFSDIQRNVPLQAELFAAKAPAGYKLINTSPNAKQEPPVALGEKAPDFKVVRTADSKPVSLSSLRGKVVLIDFWATWCGPCRKGLPFTDAIYNDFHHKGLEVLAVSADDPAKIKAYFKKAGFAMPACADPEGAATIEYNADTIPTTAIVNREGKLVSYWVGLRDDTEVRSELLKAGL